MAFDWELAAQEIRLACNTAAAASGQELPPLIVAGGLHSRNVAAAIDVLEALGRRCGQRSRGGARPQRPAAIAQFYLRGARLCQGGMRSSKVSNGDTRRGTLDIAQITEIYNSIVSDLDRNLQRSLCHRRGAGGLVGSPRGTRLPRHRRRRRSLGLRLWVFGEFRSWPGYRFTVEGTVHIREDVRGHGIGRLLLAELIARARAMGKHVIVAGVDSENQASLRFLQREGFLPAGQLKEVGYKFGRYLHLNFLQYWLTDPGSLPPSSDLGSKT